MIYIHANNSLELEEPIPIGSEKVEYTEKDKWLSVKFVSNTNLELINSKDIISSYALILNNDRKLLMYYSKEWKLPGGYLNQGDLFNASNQLIDVVKEQTGVSIKLEKLLGIKIYQGYSINKYSTYYLASIIDDKIENTDFSFDYSFDYDVAIFEKIKHEIICYFTFTKLINLSVYENNKVLFDNIYDQWKLKLILDLDRTLLESAQLTNINCDEDSLTLNDPLFINNYAPDEIIKLGHHYRFIWLRPYVHEFLDAMKNLTNIHYWTAGIKECQQSVLKITRLINYAVDIYYRDSCTLMSDGYPYKSIVCLNERLKNEKNINCYFDLNKTLLIDDMSINKVSNDENCYLISPWHVIGTNTFDLVEAFKDKELLGLIPSIKNLSDQIMHENLSIQEIIRKKKV